MEDNTNTPTLIQSLHEAALQGDVVLLQELLCKDPLLLHKPLSLSNTSPLHVACKLGHKEFVLELLRLNRNLTEELDPNDKSSILHLAARNGHLELVASLASKYPSLCFARDMLGRNPVHVAVVNGQLNVLEQLLKATPAAGRERVGPLVGGSGGDTLLHLCVKYNQYEELMMAVRMVGDAVLLNATNGDGDTIFHVAVANKRTQIVEFLLREKRLQKNTPNSNGLTAMDVFKGRPKDVNREDDVLKLKLRGANVLPSKEMKKERNKDDHLDWLEKQRSNLMVVASLIATMAFQAGINPPGGVWQESQDKDSPSPAPQSDLQLEYTLPHIAGTSVLDKTDQFAYTWILVCNTVGFVLSMSSILLLISLPRRRFSMGLIMVIMWVAICAMVFSFIPSTISLISGDDIDNTSLKVRAPFISMMVWVGLMALLLLRHIMQWTWRLIKILRRWCISIRTHNM